MKNNTLSNNNMGFSLVELIVSVLITGILMMAVAMFMSTSRSAYMAVNKSAVLQEESMVVERVLSEYLMETTYYNLQEDKIIDIYNSSDVKTGSVSVDVLTIKARENEDDTSAYFLYCFVLDKSENILRYGKISASTGNYDSDGLTNDGLKALGEVCYGPDKSLEKYSLIAEYITGWTCSSLEADSGNTDFIALEISYQYLDNDYTDRITIATRNTMDTME